jgi:hypothetical protein
MPLSLAQIDALVAQAVAAGMDTAEVEGIRQALLMRAADLDGAQKLALGQALTDAERAKNLQSFIDEMAAQHKSRMQRAADDIMGMSDEEWNAIMGEGDNE